MKEDAKPAMAKKIKEETYNLKEFEFIYKIEQKYWVSPIVIAPNKNQKLRFCVNIKKVNCPFPITNHIIERVIGKERYNYLDGF